MVSDLMLNVFM